MFLLLQVMCDLMVGTGCKYNVHNFQRLFLHQMMLRSCNSSCLGTVADVNFACVNINVKLGGCLSAKIGLVSLNFLFMSRLLMLSKKLEIVSMMCS